MSEYFFEEVKRLDWGFGNPNITAALIACLLMAVWFLAGLRIKKKGTELGFWVALGSSAVLGAMLIQTVSRGGMVAAVAGAVVLIGFAPRPWQRVKWISVMICLIGLVFFSIWHGVAGRYAQGLIEEDRSVSNRWLLYRAAPQMAVDAPEGWGKGRAGEAYQSFYQPIGRNENYISLVSSHLTSLVESAWPERFVHLLLWLAVLFLCWPGQLSKGEKWFTPALATWLTFAVVMSFTTMDHRWAVWVVPAAVLLPILWFRLIRRQWPTRRVWVFPVGLTVVVLAALLLVGKNSPTSIPVQLSKGFVVLGNEDPDRAFIMLSVDEKIIGESYGKSLRKALSDEGLKRTQVCIEWEASLSRIEARVKADSEAVVVVMGDGVRHLQGEQLVTLLQASAWIFLNPEAPAKELLENMGETPAIFVKWGEFNTDKNRLLWQGLASQHQNIEFMIVPAAGKYLPDWVDCLRHKDENEGSL